MQYVILAGGLGKRMKPVTESIPKALIEIDGKPFLKYQLDQLAKQGATRVVLCIGYRGSLIRDFIGQETWPFPIEFVDEGDHLRGTAGALRMALDENKLDETFFVLYGDSYLPIDFQAAWKRFLKSGKPALMTVIENAEQWDASNACFDGKNVTHYEKGLKDHKPAEMRFIDYGLSAFHRSVIQKEVKPGQVSDLATVFHVLSRRGELAGYELHNRFFEIGSPSGLSNFVDYRRKNKL